LPQKYRFCRVATGLHGQDYVCTYGCANLFILVDGFPVFGF